MDRRDFIKTSGKVTAAAYFPFITTAKIESPNFKMGYQLYSIRDEMSKDPIGTLRALKAMGFEDFEHFGFDAKEGTYYGMIASDFKSRLDDLELTISSGHYTFSNYLNKPVDEIRRFTDQCIKGALTVGSKHIVWPLIAPNYRNIEGYKKTAARLNQISEQINDAGLGLAYHNHGYEFADLNGTTGFEIITSETDPESVKIQIDMYWVMHSANATPAELIDKYPGRFVMWHIKDMHKESRDYTELGNGSIDYDQIMPDPKKSGLQYYYIEQGGNYTVNSIESAKYSASFFKKHLQRYL